MKKKTINNTLKKRREKNPKINEIGVWPKVDYVGIERVLCVHLCMYECSTYGTQQSIDGLMLPY